MNRRDFVKRLFAGAAGVVASELIDVERLLWVPGEKTIFLPSVEVFSGNTFITPSWVTKDVARYFLQNIKLVGPGSFEGQVDWPLPQPIWELAG